TVSMLRIVSRMTANASCPTLRRGSDHMRLPRPPSSLQETAARPPVPLSVRNAKTRCHRSGQCGSHGPRLSALPPTADAHRATVTSALCHNGPSIQLFDHLVDACEQRGRHSEAERIRGFAIDDELELGR